MDALGLAFNRLFKKRDGYFDDDGVVFGISMFFGALIGLLAGFFCAYDENPFWYFGFSGWLMASGIIFLILFLALAISEENYPLLGLGINEGLGLVFGYAIFYSITYFIVWIVKLSFFKILSIL